MIDNRSGLSAIAYRVGTFSSFRQAVLQALAGTAELAALRTRLSEDYAITLVELWAIIADVLTFYQERIANEAFLRTARLRDSVLRLARLLDYQLRPGVAATAYLAFTVDQGKQVQIPVGLRVQSVPGQDEQPQKFETLEPLIADARWNRLRLLPQPEPDTPLESGKTWAFLPPGEAGLTAAARLRPGGRLLVFDGDAREEIIVREVRREEDRLILAWSEPLQRTWPATRPVYRFTRTFRLFGYNAPVTYMAATKLTTMGMTPNASETSIALHLEQRSVWDGKEPLDKNSYSLEAGSELFLDGRYEGLRLNAGLLVIIGGDQQQYVTIGKAEVVPWTFEPLSDIVTKLTVSPPLPAILDRRTVLVYELEGDPIRLWQHRYPEKITTPEVYVSGRSIDADTVEVARVLSGNGYTPGIRLQLKDIAPGRRVLLADDHQAPLVATISEASFWSLGKKAVSPQGPGPKSYSVAVAEVPLEGYVKLRLTLDADSPLYLDTQAAVMLGNITLASHGETVKQEVVGDGDASIPFQRFSLKKKPVTFVPSATPGAVKSSLQVLVNGMRWHEAASLYGRTDTEQVYTMRLADDGTMTLQFGDAATGARLPSGRGNVVATYRHGAGLAGRVQAHALTTLLDRPVGLKSVTNPAQAEGGADPETLEQARQNAPTTVRTFGRAVSLCDFADLATASGDVAKAAATWVWDGGARVVCLTVAGQQGARFSPAALRRLYDSLTSQRNPAYTLRIVNYHPVPIVVSATLKVADNVVTADTAVAARTALLRALSFETLAFGQSLHLSDIYAILQGVAGIVAVDIDLFHFKDRSAAHLAERGADTTPVQPHLRIYPARPNPGASPVVIPAEQAWIEAPSQDIVLVTSGGLAS